MRSDKHGSSGSASSASPGTRSPTTRRASSASPPCRPSSRSGRSGRTSTRPRSCSPRRTTCSSTAPCGARSGRTRSTPLAGNGSSACARACPTDFGKILCSRSSATSSPALATTTSCVGAPSVCVPRKTSSACGTRRRRTRAPSSVFATPSAASSALTRPLTWTTSRTTIR